MYYILFLTFCGAHPISYPLGNGVSFPGGKRGVKQTTHLHLVPRLRMTEATSPLTQYVFMAWYFLRTETTLPLYLLPVLPEHRCFLVADMNDTNYILLLVFHSFLEADEHETFILQTQTFTRDLRRFISRSSP